MTRNQVWVVVCALALMMLIACGTQTGTGTKNVPAAPAANPSTPPTTPTAPASSPATTPTTVTPPATTPANPSTEAPAAPGNCLIAADRVQALCNTPALPEVVSVDGGCEFKVASTDTRPGGALWVTKVKATLDDYIAAYRAIPGEDETMELKPRSTRREQVPFTYFFWFTGTDLLTIKAHKTVCVSDNLKKMAIEIGQGKAPGQSCADLSCHDFTYSQCPDGCNKDCIPSYSSNTSQTLDCDGPDSCRCIGEPRPTPVTTPGGQFCGVSVKDACSTDDDCKVGGCSSQVCGANADKQLTTCEYKDCYKAVDFDVSCQCVNSQCQWA